MLTVQGSIGHLVLLASVITLRDACTQEHPISAAFRRASQTRSANVEAARFSWNVDVKEDGLRKKWTRELVFDRSRLRYDWHINDAQAKRRIFIFDRPAGTLFNLNSTARRDDFAYPEAILQSVDGYTPFDILPLTWMYRTPDRAFSATTDEWTTTGRVETLPAGKCYVLENVAANPTTSSPEHVQEYWVCPEKDYAILRYFVKGKRTRGIEIDVDYKREAVHGWIPTGWTATMWKRNGDVRMQETCRVIDYALNEPLPNDSFDQSLPEGSIFHDRIAERVYRIESGAKRELTTEETKRSYFGFAEPRIGQPLEPPSPPQ